MRPAEHFRASVASSRKTRKRERAVTVVDHGLVANPLPAPRGADKCIVGAGQHLVFRRVIKQGGTAGGPADGHRRSIVEGERIDRVVQDGFADADEPLICRLAENRGKRRGGRAAIKDSPTP